MSIWLVLLIVSGWYLLGYAIDRARRRFFPAASDFGTMVTWFVFLIGPIGLVAIAA
jgi:hypothetical protein